MLFATPLDVHSMFPKPLTACISSNVTDNIFDNAGIISLKSLFLQVYKLGLEDGFASISIAWDALTQGRRKQAR